MLEKIAVKLFGSKHKRDLKRLMPLVRQINEKEVWAMSLADAAFPNQTQNLKQRLKQGETLDDLLPIAFALAREAARRALGERLYESQLLGAIVLHEGRITEMKTGEGKTLASVPAAYLNSLTGQGVHIVTVNDYLAERDAAWMGSVYNYLGVSVGAVLSNMDNNARSRAYEQDITYGTNNELGFDYLRDNMCGSFEQKAQKQHNYCIIDEIDSILIDEARTPLIISGQAEDDTHKYAQVNLLVGQLAECQRDPETDDYPEESDGDYKIDKKNRRVTFTENGVNRLEHLLIRQKVIKGSLYGEDNFEYLHYATQAVRAHRLYQKDVDYVAQDGQIQIVDEFTGRILSGRRYSDGLHQAIEAKEKIKIARRNQTMATITFQNFFRMYRKIAGMTGTADTEAQEFARIYNLDVVVVPSNQPVIREDRDDLVYLNEEFKHAAIVEEVQRAHRRGQPILIGTISIENSEHIARLLTKKGIKHEVLNAKNHHREASIIAEAGARGSVTIATNMAGRGTDIKLGGNPEFRARRLAGSRATEEEYKKILAAENAKWQAARKEILEAGGLYILGTERHESRRIDNQLRGRSGRQGDPGCSCFFVSLDDSLMRLFAREGIKNLMGKIGMSSGEPLYHPLINRAIEKAQARVENRNFEIRKHLLEYDDVLNEQRNFIYRQRNEILADNHLDNRILEAARDIADEQIDSFCVQREQRQNHAVQNMQEGLRESFNLHLDPDTVDLTAITEDELKQWVGGLLAANLEEKKQVIPADIFNRFIRYEYLRHIDKRWQEHLENLESLREAVYLRAYGQKNPLLEYKLEGFDIFDKLVSDIRRALARKVIKVRIRESERSYRQAASTNLTGSHGDLSLLAAGNRLANQTAAPNAAAGQPASVTVKRAVAKVGRNDKCPCGSGKKYKRCHGS